MSPRLEELLLRWEVLRQGGKPVSVDTLCRDCPELREELRAQIAALEKMDQVLDLPDKEQPVVKNERRRTRYDDLRSGWEPIAGYRLEKKLGSGGFGEVWKTIGPGGFSVALKFVSLTNQLGASELRSLDVIKTLRHPNLLAIFGAWQVHGFLVIAMEMADKTLLDRLNEAQANGETGIPHAELIRYMEAAAKGIDYLNQPDASLGDSAKEAIQHRDIKPQNILLMGGGVKIGDFGLVRILKNTMTEHTGSLTVSYAAPEFFMGHTSRSSDQYSLAVTYCHLRGGRLPFTGQPGQIMQGHLEGTPDLTMLPEAERPIVMRALAKKPEDRWQSCTLFVNALTTCNVSHAATEKKGSRVPVRPKPSGRHRFVLTVGLATLLLIIGLLWLWDSSVPEDTPPDGTGVGKPNPLAGQPDKDKKMSPPEKEPMPASPFDHLVLNNATRIEDFVRLSPDSWIGTKESYTGPIEITVIARTEKNDIRLHAYRGTCVIFNWEGKPNELRVNRPDGTDKKESGSLAKAKVRPLDPNKWYTLRWRITNRGMNVFVDGKQVFIEHKTNKFSVNWPVALTSHKSVLDVRSLVVTRLGVKDKP